MGDLKSRACSVCCAARVWAAWVKAAPAGGLVGPAVGGLETAGRHAPMKSAMSPIASKTNPFLFNIALLLDVAGSISLGIAIPEMPLLSYPKMDEKTDFVVCAAKPHAPQNRNSSNFRIG